MKKTVQRNEHGQTLLEFALVAPLMLFFVLALVDFGIAIDRRLVLDHAVREGARFASVGGDALNGLPAGVGEVKFYTAAQSQGIADATAADGTNGFISVCDDGGGGLQVSIDYTYQLVTPIAALANLGNFSIPLFAKASARVEQPLTDAGSLVACDG